MSLVADLDAKIRYKLSHSHPTKEEIAVETAATKYIPGVNEP